MRHGVSGVLGASVIGSLEHAASSGSRTSPLARSARCIDQSASACAPRIAVYSRRSASAAAGNRSISSASGGLGAGC